MAKGIQNIDAVTHKLGPVSTRTTNHKLKAARKVQRNREEMVERRKTEAMAAKCCRDRRRISLFNREKKNY